MMLSIHHLDGRRIAETWFSSAQAWINSCALWIKYRVAEEFECPADDVSMPTEGDGDLIFIVDRPVARLVFSSALVPSHDLSDARVACEIARGVH